MRSSLSSLSCFPSLNPKTTLLLSTHHNPKPHFPHLTSSFSSSPSSLLSSCQDLGTLKKIHASLIVSTANHPVSVPSRLITLYSQFHDLKSANLVFNGIIEPSTVAWNSIIKSHVDLGFPKSALRLYRRTWELGIPRDSFTLPIIIKAIFWIPNCIRFVGIFHCIAIRTGFAFETYFCNTVIDVCVKCGSIRYALKVFDEMPIRDLVSWTSAISGYSCEGSVVIAFELFNEMRMVFEPNPVTMITMLQACANSENLVGGMEIHGYIVKNGMVFDGSVQNSILQMYTKTRSATDVEKLFSEIDGRDVISWNILISFYSLEGNSAKVCERFNEMRENILPSVEILTSVVSALADSGNLSGGKKVHCFAVKSGIHDGILQTSLLNCYSKCGELESSLTVFQEISCRNDITWASLISGFIQNGRFIEAIQLFHQFLATGFKPTAEILQNTIVACTNLVAFQLGKEIQCYLLRNLSCSQENNTALETSILNFYIRCGRIATARLFFDRMKYKDTITWTCMIEGCGVHGLGLEAIKLFHRMVELGTLPNKATFLSVLSACSHCGLLSQACEAFYSMKWEFGIEPDLDHCTCIVDLLGRSGNLREAAAVILKMVRFPDSRIWGALLASSSRVYGKNNKLGEYAAKRVLELEPDNIGYYILLSNMQAGAEKWGEVEDVRRVLSEKELKKKPGWSCIEGEGGTEGFVAGDRTHPRSEEIYEVLGHLSQKIQQFGCVCVL